jgi:glyoxylase-like metal-dependent hydrolase (beta-lactamase superfamily II)
VSEQVIYRQINKDYAYWIEKRRLGQQKGGHVSGLLTHLDDNGQVKQNILIDAGLGTIEGLADLCDDSFWDEPLVVFITHGHIDHHAELMVLAEIYCTRRGTTIHDVRPPLPIFCTTATQEHLFSTHRYGYTGGETLQHRPIESTSPVQLGLFTITPLAVDHFEGAVIFTIEFGQNRRHKILIGWDMTTLPPI